MTLTRCLALGAQTTAAEASQDSRDAAGATRRPDADCARRRRRDLEVVEEGDGASLALRMRIGLLDELLSWATTSHWSEVQVAKVARETRADRESRAMRLGGSSPVVIGGLAPRWPGTQAPRIRTTHAAQSALRV